MHVFESLSDADWSGLVVPERYRDAIAHWSSAEAGQLLKQ